MAVVQLVAASGLPPTVMRDYADPAHPRTVCTFRDGFVLQLIDPKHIVVQGSCPSANVCYAVVDLPEVRFHWFALPTGTYDEFYAMSPNGAQIAWTSANQTGSDRQIHVTDASGDHIVAALRDEAGRCGSPTDSRRGAYTRSGSFLFVLDQPQVRDNVLVVASGTKRVFLLAPPATAAGWAMTQYPYMALWSPTSPTLFYARGTDVWRWTPTAGPKIFLPGVEWFSPTITPNGRYLAYSVLQADGIHHDVYLVDLVSGASPRLIGHNRTVPAFVNNTQLWWMTEEQQFCGAGGLKPAIYNMTDHTEAPSIIDSVIDTWPGTHS